MHRVANARWQGVVSCFDSRCFESGELSSYKNYLCHLSYLCSHVPLHSLSTLQSHAYAETCSGKFGKPEGERNVMPTNKRKSKAKVKYRPL